MSSNIRTVWPITPAIFVAAMFFLLFLMRYECYDWIAIQGKPCLVIGIISTALLCTACGLGARRTSVLLQNFTLSLGAFTFVASILCVWLQLPIAITSIVFAIYASAVVHIAGMVLANGWTPIDSSFLLMGLGWVWMISGPMLPTAHEYIVFEFFGVSTMFNGVGIAIGYSICQRWLKQL